MHLKIQNGSHLKGHIQYLTSVEHNLLATKINIGKNKGNQSLVEMVLVFWSETSGVFSLEDDEMVRNQAAPMWEINVIKLM